MRGGIKPENAQSAAEPRYEIVASAVTKVARDQFRDDVTLAYSEYSLVSDELDWIVSVLFVGTRRSGLGRGLTALIPSTDERTLGEFTQGRNYWKIELNPESPTIEDDAAAAFVRRRSQLPGSIAEVDVGASRLVDSLGRLLAEKEQLLQLLEQRTGELEVAERRIEDLGRVNEQLRSAQREVDTGTRKGLFRGSGAIVLALTTVLSAGLAAGGAVSAARVTADATRDAAVIATQTSLTEKVFDYRKETGTLPTDPEELIVAVKADAARLIDTCGVHD